MAVLPPKVEIDFTEELLTSKGGLTFPAQIPQIELKRDIPYAFLLLQPLSGNLES